MENSDKNHAFVLDILISIKALIKVKIKQPVVKM